MKTLLNSKTIKTIKSHGAYQFNVAREEEANCTLIDNQDGTFTIDPWGTVDQPFKALKTDNLTLEEALDTLLFVNDEEAFFGNTWNMKGL